MSLQAVEGPKVRDILLMLSLPVPEFRRVTAAVARLKKGTLPKLMLDGVRVAIGPPLITLDTVRLKLWAAAIPTPLLAVKLIGNTPDAAGVPLRVPVPL